MNPLPDEPNSSSGCLQPRRRGRTLLLGGLLALTSAAALTLAISGLRRPFTVSFAGYQHTPTHDQAILRFGNRTSASLHCEGEFWAIRDQNRVAPSNVPPQGTIYVMFNIPPSGTSEVAVPIPKGTGGLRLVCPPVTGPRSQWQRVSVALLAKVGIHLCKEHGSHKTILKLGFRQVPNHITDYTRYYPYRPPPIPPPPSTSNDQ